MSVVLAAVGDVMLDVSAQTADDVHEATLRVGGGGVAANVAVWATAAGAHATVVGRVGDDLAGRALAAELEARGVQAALAVDATRPTGTFARLDGRVAVDLGANAALAAADLERLPPADVLVVSGRALRYADGARAALDVPRAAWTVVAGGVAAGARLVVVAAAEAGGATAADLARSHEAACVTYGARGAELAVGGALVRAAPEAVAAGPAVGSGDALAATLAVGLAAGRSPAEALEAAVAAGARAAALGGWPPARGAD